jgi:hypothetical protein
MEIEFLLKALVGVGFILLASLAICEARFRSAMRRFDRTHAEWRKAKVQEIFKDL